MDLRDSLLTRAKAAAARERITLTRMIEEGLALRLRRPAMLAARREIPVSPRKGGLRPGIDPRSNRSMFDAADE